MSTDDASPGRSAGSETRPIRILLVDDHPILRKGLCAVLAAEAAVDVVGEASTGQRGLELARELRPDVVVMDVGMPDMNGIEATRLLQGEMPEVRVIALSTYSDKRYVLSMLDAGASGYVIKAAAADELLRAIQAVAAGKRFLSPEITSVVLRSRSGPPRDTRSLGQREREVLQLLAEGLTTIKIGERLHIAPKTVETHRRNISRKLGVRSIAELTKYAIREGLTPLDP